MENRLTPEEERFISYWEKNRQRERKSLNQLMIGFPLGIVFGAPILLNAFTGWYKRADMEVNSRGSYRSLHRHFLTQAPLGPAGTALQRIGGQKRCSEKGELNVYICGLPNQTKI